MKLIFKTIILSFLLALSLTAKAQDVAVAQPDSTASKFENVHISLLTCGGYDEIWALYGHSALRIEMPDTGEDLAVNWGLFDFTQPNFIGRFMFGKCDYFMGMVPFEVFLKEFSAKNSTVFQQEINLTPEEKESVLLALYENSLAENCMYRYNFFYDNCATRPRNIILNNIPDKIVYTNEIDSTISFRNIIHANNEQKPWCRLGNDLLLGVDCDKPTTRDNQQFLPANMQRDFANAVFVDSAGNQRPVVLASKWVLEGKPTYTKEFPLSPAQCGFVILTIAILLTAVEIRQKKSFWMYDAAVLTICGIVGVILFLMIFSEHPTVSVNLLILTFNPLLLVFLWRIIKELRGKKSPLACMIYLALVIITCICGIAGLQSLPEGFYGVATAIALRLLAVNMRNNKPHKTAITA